MLVTIIGSWSWHTCGRFYQTEVSERWVEYWCVLDPGAVKRFQTMISRNVAALQHVLGLCVVSNNLRWLIECKHTTLVHLLLLHFVLTMAIDSLANESIWKQTEHTASMLGDVGLEECLLLTKASSRKVTTQHFRPLLSEEVVFSYWNSQVQKYTYTSSNFIEHYMMLYIAWTI